jgi:hypothetical protein
LNFGAGEEMEGGNDEGEVLVETNVCVYIYMRSRAFSAARNLPAATNSSSH